MITYAYWGCIFLLVMLLMYWLGGRLDKWKLAFGASIIVLFAGWATYYFHFQQIFVKRYGGVMSVTVPDGHHHISATWKDENLWIENYNPKNNSCSFEEYSKSNVLQGKVTIKNCNPIALKPRQSQSASIPVERIEQPPANPPAFAN
jgi:hypothetical protein